MSVEKPNFLTGVKSRYNSLVADRKFITFKTAKFKSTAHCQNCQNAEASIPVGAEFTNWLNTFKGSLDFDCSKGDVSSTTSLILGLSMARAARLAWEQAGCSCSILSVRGIAFPKK